MFGLGPIEILIVAALIAFALRPWITRRWPRLGRSLWMVLLLMLGGVLIFDLIAWLR